MSRPDFIVTGSTVYAVNEIVNYLTPHLVSNDQAIDRVPSVERHIGQFNTPEEVTRWLSHKNGGVRIAALRARNVENVGGELLGNVDFVAYIFCADYYGYNRDQRAEVIAARVAQLMVAKGGLKSAAQRASRCMMDNLYSGKIDDKGIAIWAVSWTQTWRLDNPLDVSTLDDFITLNSQTKLVDGAPTGKDTVTLPQDEN